MRPAWLEIDLDAFAHNLRQVRQFTGSGVGLIAVVKADAYGHGAAAVAPVAEAAGAELLAVALAQEGVALRDAGVRAPILVLGAAAPDEAQAFVESDLIANVCELAFAKALSSAAAALGTVARCHIKVDTGMGRLGVRAEEARSFAEAVRALPGLRVEGVFSHFASAPWDLDFTAHQTRVFAAAAAQVQAALAPARLMLHLANSGGLVACPESWQDAVRPGALLYGIFCCDGAVPALGTRQVMTLKARIVSVRKVRKGESVGYDRTWTAEGDTWVAVVPLGYADGYPRALSGRAEVLVRGRRCPVVGRVSMDSMVVDVGALPGVEIGEEVVLLGTQGDQTITTLELATRADTIVQEIASRMGARLPRVYVGGAGAGESTES